MSANAESTPDATSQLASGTYEVLRNRLRESATDLRERFERLNQARAEVFGNIETKLGATAHVSTDNNCVPRDLLAIGDRFLLGYNVQFGLKTEVDLKDVFSLYRLEEEIAHPLPLEDIFTPEFKRDFAELYRYYKNTQFSRFFVQGPLVYAVFQIGKSVSDIKAFKWALEGDSLRYVDARSDQDVKFPQQHGFRWQRATRDQHRSGLHPHVSIHDIVFVECVGGDLTIKVEDNTEDGNGIYAEPVDNPDQTLDDAEVYYCVLGNLVLLKMRPYQEKDFRHLAFSVKRQRAWRLDGIEQSCVLLPDDHGIIFPTGFVLQTGTHKLFDHGLTDLVYERTVAAPNGEDFLYVFTDLETGTYLHLRYNLIRQEVDTPLICHGQAFFDDGAMVTFRSQDTAAKHHALQLWQTPYVGPNFQTEVSTDSMLYKIGNRELVRGMAECQELLQLIDKDDSYSELYLDLVKRSTDVLDSYFWLDREETMQLSQPLAQIRDAASAAVEEFDKVVRVRRETEQDLQQTQHNTKELIDSIGRSSFKEISDFVKTLASIREQRGHSIGLRELHFIDLEAVEQLETTLAEAADRVGHRCVQFLLDENSLQPYANRLDLAEEEIAKVDSASAGKKLEKTLEQIGNDLELLIETVSQLKIEDLTQRTAIVDRTGDLLAELNRTRSGLKARVRDLLSGEMEADFASQTKLLDQATAGALETADSPERVDDALTRIMLQVEELEGRFAEYDELLSRLTEKRESLYEAFEARRTQLVEVRSRRAESLAGAAERIMQGITSRANRLKDADELRSYFASDPMVDKVHSIAKQLAELGDSVRQEDTLSRLKAISDDALRQLRDRKDLFTGGEGLISLGKHQFTVNKQSIELTSVIRGGELKIHLTGTQFFQPFRSKELEESQDLWNQFLPSESDEVYRAEYLAADLFYSWTGKEKRDFLNLDLQPQVEQLRSIMQTRHDEGYSRGVHDSDAAKILVRLLQLETQLGLLRYAPKLRGLARFVWFRLVPQLNRERTAEWASQFAIVRATLPETRPSKRYVERITSLLRRYGKSILKESQAEQAANYIFSQLQMSREEFLLSPVASTTLKRLLEHLPADERKRLMESTTHSKLPAVATWTLALDAVDGYLRSESPTSEQEDSEEEGQETPDDAATHYREEIAAQLLLQEQPTQLGPDLDVAISLDSIAGDHPRIQSGKLHLQYHRFTERLGRYRDEVVPRYHRLKHLKSKLLQEADEKIRSHEFKARVLTSFVRNQLIVEVYRPLVDDNLAKQMGSAGENKRTDRMGLLLLISPPGYGKTTLMEYIANRLGLVFVKINGPALGHNVTSLDPSEASNASAKEEVERINLALEMGDNVMLYLDDIQHCNPELLQKFIPLCDATRRIEGVWEGEPKTYDLRGRKFAVIMAGNPYTESGDRFQIPDMLSNRADVYNLGEIIGDSAEAFELSYIENCLTSNSSLQALARHSSKDQRAVIRAAQRDSIEDLELESSISSDNLQDMISVLGKLLRVRDIVLQVNRTYIQSAAQADAYRTEPPFKLQGSYRNMNRIAERIVPVMNDQELETLVFANYEQDAQTLTRDGESNLLKFKELVGSMSVEEKQRWESIKYAYVESVRMQGIEGDDAAAKVLRSLSGLRDGLESIRRVMAQAVESNEQEQQANRVLESIDGLHGGLSGLGEQLSQALEAASRAQQEIQPPDQKVLVQHSVPRVMTDLIESQFQLLYDGLRPVLENSAGSKSQLESLQRAVQDCLEDYRRLQGEIDDAKGNKPSE
ncbi:MAG: DNA repair ATPase [Planctomycetota bacterium]